MEKETTIITTFQQPGYLAGREAAANISRFDSPQQDEDANAAKAEKAAFARAARKQAADEEEKKKREASQSAKPGFAAPVSSATSLGPTTNQEPVKDFDLRGKGWIYCGKNARGQGTWLKDCGDSIEVPFSKKYGMSDGQKRKILELAHEKGWNTLYAFKSNGRQLHPLATQILQSSGIPCCTDPKLAKTLDTWKSLCREQRRQHCEAAANQPHLQQSA